MNISEKRLLSRLDRIEKMVLLREKPFLSLAECSDYLGISRNTIYQLTSKQKIPHYKIGKRLMFKVSDVDLWVLDKKNKVYSMKEIDTKVSTDLLREE